MHLPLKALCLRVTGQAWRDTSAHQGAGRCPRLQPYVFVHCAMFIGSSSLQIVHEACLEWVCRSWVLWGDPHWVVFHCSFTCPDLCNSRIHFHRLWCHGFPRASYQRCPTIMPRLQNSCTMLQDIAPIPPDPEHTIPRPPPHPLARAPRGGLSSRLFAKVVTCPCCRSLACNVPLQTHKENDRSQGRSQRLVGKLPILLFVVAFSSPGLSFFFPHSPSLCPPPQARRLPGQVTSLRPTGFHQGHPCEKQIGIDIDKLGRQLLIY